MKVSPTPHHTYGPFTLGGGRVLTVIYDRSYTNSNQHKPKIAGNHGRCMVSPRQTLGCLCGDTFAVCVLTRPVPDDSGNYVSQEGQAYTDDELEQMHGLLSRQAGNPLVSGLFAGPKSPLGVPADAKIADLSVQQRRQMESAQRQYAHGIMVHMAAALTAKQNAQRAARDAQH
jgi:hypothetical protein